jgi:hypothetical protein
MNRAAALMAASIVVVMAGCTSERPVSDVVQAAPVETEGNDAKARPEASAAIAVLRSEAARHAQGSPEVRDAKEAAEDAARRIFDATLLAATRIRDAGIGAVQAVGGLGDGDKLADAGANRAESDPPEPVQN